ncbi:conserved hypothetical protein [Lebetimonas natsushimae]|uniref:Uncharacterized protein n=1 Tax=Lebetimonas natsushimae TaxID=1936991 RepID=A0A292YC77_9BACT|nr:hypothetical protein [Lebetimonas natsushimae]GAX86975.1 conserved hypothetical protein [Lebetimonas natsushimae]
MFIKKFIKQQFISCYYDENYKLLYEIYKNNNLLEENRFEFEEKKGLIKKIKELSEEIPQTYTSTIIQTINQGVVPSCQKTDFAKYGIETENIKYICVNNKYAFYTSLYDLMEAKKINIDFIYSIFALMDYKATKKINTLYILITKEKFYILIYHKNIPIFSDIYEKAEELLENDENELENLDNENIIENIEDDIIDDIDNIDESEIDFEDNKITTGIEMDVINFIKSSLEEYYENFADDFIENIIIFDNDFLNEDITKIIYDTLLIESKKENLDILKTINEISRKNV